jgi:hypothetical protein
LSVVEGDREGGVRAAPPGFGCKPLVYIFILEIPLQVKWKEVENKRDSGQQCLQAEGHPFFLEVCELIMIKLKL